MIYIGIINIFFVIITTLVLIKIYGNFNWKRQTYSELGDGKQTGKWFNLVLIIFSINQVLFALQVSQAVFPAVSFLFLAGGISLGMVGLFTTGKHPIIHGTGAVICAILVATGVILVSLKIINIKPWIGYSSLLATFFMPITFFMQRRFPGARWETALFSCVAIWNICFTFAIT